jgi:hypothetical protein
MEPAGNLEQERTLADAGLAAHEHERAWYKAASEHEIEFGNTALVARNARSLDIHESDNAGWRSVPRPVATTASRCCRRCIDERIPGAARRTLTFPA